MPSDVERKEKVNKKKKCFQAKRHYNVCIIQSVPFNELYVNSVSRSMFGVFMSYTRRRGNLDIYL